MGIGLMTAHFFGLMRHSGMQGFRICQVSHGQVLSILHQTEIHSIFRTGHQQTEQGQGYIFQNRRQF